MRKGTNPDVGALARTIAAGYNRDGCEAQRGRYVRQQSVYLGKPFREKANFKRVEVLHGEIATFS